MAQTVIQGADIEFLVRKKNTGDFKTLVCEESVVLDVTNDVTTTKTKCGTFKGVQTADFKLNGSAVFNATPTVSEVSYDDVLAWQLDLDEIEFIIRNVAITGFTAGQAIRMSGTGYFTSTNFNGSQGEVSKFTWNIEGTGTLNDTES